MTQKSSFPVIQIEAFKEMAAFTAPICAAGKDECRSPFRCCKRKFCKLAEKNIQKAGIDIVPFKRRIMFLGPNGCIVPPHLRPVCTIHVCTVSWAAKSHIEHDERKTREYFELRNKLENAYR